ncbi:GlsB/YeaQ/YmgE family stress response membrane protein [Acidocella sp.]|uniref:GlsB/YeaQ/YmgE family stress response membrane protein n=1 Tax=Acidocella sp. TaxID=50710 RepID=UPI002602D17C|nr:GlsB/YeaQ/YmgE family stress response membrane protein [Acidocella sp.]
MYLSNESLLVIILVGIVAGFLAGKIVDGGGFGLVGDLIVGVLGALIGDWMLPRLHIHLGVGIVSLVLSATAGAIVLLVVLRVFTGGRWGGGGRRWGWGRR